MLLAHPRVFGNSTTADSLNFKWATRNVPKIQALHMDSGIDRGEHVASEIHMGPTCQLYGE